jgi:hypothetical protein
VSETRWSSLVECCGNCAFWPLGGYQHNWKGAPPLGMCGPGSDGSLSECRRHAPNTTDQSKYPSKTAAWPSTARNDYCGDFERKAERDKPEAPLYPGGIDDMEI